MDRPKISKDICKEAQIFLKGVIDELANNESLNTLDYPLIELLGETYHHWFIANQVVKKWANDHPAIGANCIMKSGDMKAHPAVKQALDESIQLTKIYEMLGLSTKSRKEIGKSKSVQTKKTPMDKFLEGEVETR